MASTTILNLLLLTIRVTYPTSRSWRLQFSKIASLYLN